MWAFSAGVILLGVALGFMARRTLKTTLNSGSLRVATVVVAAAVVALAVLMPDGWLKFGVTLLQAPLVGLAIAVL